MRSALILAVLLLAVPCAQAQQIEIPLPGIGPFDVELSPDGSRLYVPQFGQFSPVFVLGTTVAVIDTATDTVVDEITVGLQPQEVAFTLDGTHAFVVNSGSASVSVIDVASGTAVATVPIGVPFATFPFGIAITPDGARATVTSTGGNFDGSEENIFVLDAMPSSPTFGTVIDTIELTGGFTRPAFRDRGREMVVGRGFAGNIFTAPPRITRFAMQQGRNVLLPETVIVPAPGGVHGVEDIAVTANGRYAYVPVFNFTGGTDEVFLADLTMGRVIDIVRLGSGDDSQHGITIDPAGLLVPVTNFSAGTVSVIFTPTNTVVQTITVGALPNEVIFTPDSRRLYVTNQGANSVTAIEFPSSADLVVDLVMTATVDPSIAFLLLDHVRTVQRDPRTLPQLVWFIFQQSQEDRILIGAPKDLDPPGEDLNRVDVKGGGINAGGTSWPR